MENFSKFFSKNFLQKLSLLLVLFLGGCELTPVVAPLLKYLLSDKTGVVTVDDVSIRDGGVSTMYFTISSDAYSTTLYTLDSTNTLAFAEGSYNTHSDGDYTYAIYEGSNIKLHLSYFDLKKGTYKLYSNGVLIDQGNFVWWIGNIDLNSVKTFIEHFDNGETYDDYQYNDRILTKNGVDYTYDDDCVDNKDGTLTGTFWNNMNYLEVIVTTATETIEITERFFPSYWSNQIAAGGHICFGMDATVVTVDHDGTGGVPFSYNKVVIDGGFTKYKYQNGDNVVYFWENDNDNTSMYVQYNTETAKLVYFDTDMVSELSDIVAGVTGTDTDNDTLVFSSLRMRSSNTLTYNGKTYRHNRSFYDADTDTSSGVYMYGFEELNIYDVDSAGGIHSSGIAFYFPTDFTYEGVAYKYIAGDILYNDTLLPMTTASGNTYYWNRANDNNVYFKTDNGITGLQGVTSTKDGYATRILVAGEYFDELNGNDCFGSNIDGDIFIDGNVKFLGFYNGNIKGNVYLNGNAYILEIHSTPYVDYVYINGNVTGDLILLDISSVKPYVTGNVRISSIPYDIKLVENAGATVNSAMNEYISENIEKILTGLGISEQFTPVNK